MIDSVNIENLMWAFRLLNFVRNHEQLAASILTTIYNKIMKHDYEQGSSLQKKGETFIRYNQTVQCDKCQNIVTVSGVDSSWLPWHMETDRGYEFCWTLKNWVTIIPSFSFLGSDTCKAVVNQGRYLGNYVWQPYGCMTHTYSHL